MRTTTQRTDTIYPDLPAHLREQIGYPEAKYNRETKEVVAGQRGGNTGWKYNDKTNTVYKEEA